MSKVIFPVKNISCDACDKVISRLVSKFEGARFESISPDQRALEITCNENDVKEIRSVLAKYNYLDENSLGGVSQVRHVFGQVFAGAESFRAEHVFLSRIVIVFAVLFALTALFQIFVLNRLGNAQSLWPLLVLVPFGITANMASLWHARLLREQLLCNTGMMVGMTIGMMSGFMLGAIIGATNGMFVGSVAGMLVGMFFGAWAGKWVGIMGLMEGMMAGLMAGLMGAMVSVMMITDNLVPFMYILFASCGVIIAGLSYLIFRESGPLLDEQLVPSLMQLLLFGLIALVFVTALAVFGPKSAIAWGAV